jgi:hypothetical protein
MVWLFSMPKIYYEGVHYEEKIDCTDPCGRSRVFPCAAGIGSLD